MGHMDWLVAAPYVASILALVASGFAVWDARLARRETAKIELARAREASLADVLELFRKGSTQDVAEALIERRDAAETALSRSAHLLDAPTRDKLRAEMQLLEESQAYLAGARMGLTWKGDASHLIAMNEFPTRVSCFGREVEGAFRDELDRVGTTLRALL